MNTPKPSLSHSTAHSATRSAVFGLGHFPSMRRVLTLFGLGISAACTSCGDTRMQMDGNMKMEGAMQMDGRVETILKLDGPITMNMQMQGPTIEYEGIYISDALLDRVDEDETTADWILAVFGEPTSRAELNDGTEIWKWSYTPKAQTASLLSLWGGTQDEPRLQPSSAYLQLRNGKVIDKWRD